MHVETEIRDFILTPERRSRRFTREPSRGVACPVPLIPIDMVAGRLRGGWGPLHLVRRTWRQGSVRSVFSHIGKSEGGSTNVLPPPLELRAKRSDLAHDLLRPHCNEARRQSRRRPEEMAAAEGSSRERRPSRRQVRHRFRCERRGDASGTTARSREISAELSALPSIRVSSDTSRDSRRSGSQSVSESGQRHRQSSRRPARRRRRPHCPTPPTRSHPGWTGTSPITAPVLPRGWIAFPTQAYRPATIGPR